MDRLLLISAVFLISFSSWASTKEQIQIELMQAEATQERLYRNLKASMGEPVVMKAPKARHRLKVRSAPPEYKIKLIKQTTRLAKNQKR